MKYIDILLSKFHKNENKAGILFYQLYLQKL